MYIASAARRLAGEDLNEQGLAETHDVQRAALFDHFPYSKFCEVVVWLEAKGTREEYPFHFWTRFSRLTCPLLGRNTTGTDSLKVDSHFPQCLIEPLRPLRRYEISQSSEGAAHGPSPSTSAAPWILPGEAAFAAVRRGGSRNAKDGVRDTREDAAGESP